MPGWVQVVLMAAALVGACGVLWGKVLHPLIRGAATADEMLPLLVDLTSTFKGDASALRVLHEIADQFRTDGGSSLRDVVNRLEAAADDNRTTAEGLKIGVETTRAQAEADRQKIETFIAYQHKTNHNVLSAATLPKKMLATVVDRLEHMATRLDALDAIAPLAESVPLLIEKLENGAPHD